MVKTWVMICLLVAAPLIARGIEKSRPMSEMHGDCSSYKTDLHEELAAWERPSLSISANDRISLPLLRKVSLALQESQKVNLPQKPEKSFPVNGQSFAGVFPPRFAKSGFVRVAAGQDLVRPR